MLRSYSELKLLNIISLHHYEVRMKVIPVHSEENLRWVSKLWGFSPV